MPEPIKWQRHADYLIGRHKEVPCPECSDGHPGLVDASGFGDLVTCEERGGRGAVHPDGVMASATYRLLERGEIIARGDEVLGDDTVTWHPVDRWSIGTSWDGSAYMPVRRRTAGVMASQAPSYRCVKCGYVGPQQIGHQRPNGKGECGYIAHVALGVQEVPRA